MRHFTAEELEALAEDEGVRRRIGAFLSMDDRTFFEEVRANLSPEDLEEYLKENPEQRRFLEP